MMSTIKDFFKSIYYVYYHTPNEKLNEQERNKIKTNGLIHFCNGENADNILTIGVQGNLKRPMFNKEKGYTWYYIYDKNTFGEKVKIVHSKGDRKNYDAYIIVKDLSEEQLNKLRIRREIDDAVIYPGTLKTNVMSKGYIEEKD